MSCDSLTILKKIELGRFVHASMVTVHMLARPLTSSASVKHKCRRKHSFRPGSFRLCSLGPFSSSSIWLRRRRSSTSRFAPADQENDVCTKPIVLCVAERSRGRWRPLCYPRSSAIWEKNIHLASVVARSRARRNKASTGSSGRTARSL